MIVELAEAALTRAELPQALRVLASDQRLDVAASPVAPTGADAVEDLAARAGFRARAVSMPPATLARKLRDAAPLLLELDDERYLLVIASRRRHLVVLRPGGDRLEVPLAAVAAALRERDRRGPPNPERGALSARVEALLESEAAQRSALSVGWLLENAVTSATGEPLLDRSAALRSLAIVICHLGQFAFWILSWVVLGTIIVTDAIGAQWLPVWLLCLLAMLLFRLGTRWLSGTLALELGTRIKQRVLAAILSLTADDARRIGLGRTIAASVDANRLDTLAVSGAVTTVLGLVEVLMLLALLTFVEPLLGLLLLVFVLGVAALAGRYLRRHRSWHQANLEATALHAEEMVGQRARKALLGVSRWYDAEDEALVRYGNAAAREDRLRLLFVLVPRAWLVLGVGLVILAGALAAGVVDLAVIAALGLVLLGYGSLQRISMGLTHLLAAFVSSRHLLDVLVPRAPAEAQVALTDPLAGATEPRLVARDLEFRYPGSPAPVLAGASFDVGAGERFLVEGSSGSGKSTLGRVLCGRLKADRGSVLLGGLDQHVAGSDAWRRNVCYVPQFHNNHVLTETLLFNLLLGRPWPPTREDMRRLPHVLDAVGLTALVERMPAGLMQMVGESGWRLSQGEQARLFVARGMLQAPRLLIVDEPLSALDSATADEVLEALCSLDCMLMLITHR